MDNIVVRLKARQIYSPVPQHQENATLFLANSGWTHVSKVMGEGKCSNPSKAASAGVVATE